MDALERQNNARKITEFQQTRQSGRTTRSLEHAIKTARENRAVQVSFVVLSLRQKNMLLTDKSFLRNLPDNFTIDVFDKHYKLFNSDSTELHILDHEVITSIYNTLLIQTSYY